MKHVDTYAYQQAKLVLDNTEELWDKLNPTFEQAHTEGWTKEKLAARIRRAALYMVGYTDYDTPPISRRSIKFWADMTAEDEV